MNNGGQRAEGKEESIEAESWGNDDSTRHTRRDVSTTLSCVTRLTYALEYLLVDKEVNRRAEYASNISTLARRQPMINVSNNTLCRLHIFG